MVTRALFYAATLALCATTLASDAKADGDVMLLTSKNVKAVLKENEYVFVKFYAPWCGHCQAMAEDFKSAATALKGKAVLAEVDATKEEELAKNYNVEGFPTLKLFSSGEEVADYQGNRDKESMVKFVERARLPAFDTVKDKATFDAFIDANKGNQMVIAVAPQGAGDTAFKKAAYSIRDVLENVAFVAISDPKLMPIAAEQGDVYYSAVPEGDRKYEKFDGEKYASIEKFVKTVGLPLFQEFTQENADMYVELGIPVIVGFFKDAEQAGVEIMNKVAQKKAGNGKVAFAWVDSVKLASFVEYVGLKDKDPAICAYSFESDQRFLLPEGFKMSEAAFEKWADAMIAGTIEATRKSEPIPDDNEGPLYTVVGDSWEDIVEDSKTDVLIAQVASWCGHCKALKPIYAKVAEKLSEAGIKTVKLALMDATENDAPADYKARGFPTIHFFAAGEQQTGIEFDGDRSSKSIIEWLQAKVTHKFEFDTSTLGADPEASEEEEPEFGEGEGEDGEYDEDESVPEEGMDAPGGEEEESEEKQEL